MAAESAIWRRKIEMLHFMSACVVPGITIIGVHILILHTWDSAVVTI